MTTELKVTRDLAPGDQLTDSREVITSVEKWGGVVYRIGVDRTLDDGRVVAEFFYAGEDAEHYGVVSA